MLQSLCTIETVILLQLKLSLIEQTFTAFFFISPLSFNHILYSKYELGILYVAYF